MPSVTAEAVEAQVRILAAAQPDFVYWPDRPEGVGCRNIPDDDQPGCIVGQALILAGFPIAEFDAENYRRSPVDTLGPFAAGYITGDTRWLSAVQNEQDQRQPWGHAVASADACVDR